MDDNVHSPSPPPMRTPHYPTAQHDTMRQQRHNDNGTHGQHNETQRRRGPPSNGNDGPARPPPATATTA
ncbi:uncharacterized protein LACBIDRAFT_307761 [Laccaria bicolor S238N-H82]|uniref:Predicted protein n=1 Tax=Laccaria bicolor (strain S238N-H82 / ATCC MYA-4686) TaxID=486041 RepID=B0DQY5_LACBS|nr:uncharacterized protein LACBIDRAFT_307761 [Laccaria bicolor S238N-H82]EDR02905.1 predicted protein [Laccaria bicolor S238N-H82]|eukprot:XP_001886328.1 predicted protein [Laccaria bicolor S238N-H82]